MYFNINIKPSKGQPIRQIFNLAKQFNECNSHHSLLKGIQEKICYDRFRNTKRHRLKMSEAISILSINDSLTDQHTLNKILLQAYKPLNLHQAQTSDQAILYLKEQKIDLIIQDIIRPGEMNGDQFLHWLRNDNNFNYIPVIIMSLLSAEKIQHLLTLPPVFNHQPPIINQSLIKLINTII